MWLDRWWFEKLTKINWLPWYYLSRMTSICIQCNASIYRTSLYDVVHVQFDLYLNILCSLCVVYHPPQGSKLFAKKKTTILWFNQRSIWNTFQLPGFPLNAIITVERHLSEIHSAVKWLHAFIPKLCHHHHTQTHLKWI